MPLPCLSPLSQCGSDKHPRTPHPSHPEKSWSEILPSLQALNLNPTSMQAIASNIKSPQPFDTLLNQLNRDFAFPLLAQCYRIAQMDGVTNAAERARVMKAIATKFDIDLNSIKSAVHSPVAPVGPQLLECILSNQEPLDFSLTLCSGHSTRLIVLRIF